MFYMLMLVVSIFYYPKKTKILKGEEIFYFKDNLHYKYRFFKNYSKFFVKKLRNISENTIIFNI